MVQCGAVYRSVLQCVAVWYSVLRCVPENIEVLCCHLLQCAAVCCRLQPAMQCVAAPVHTCTLLVWRKRTSTDLRKHFPKSVEVLYPQTRGVHVCTGAATHCTTLQHTATHCNPLQHTVTQCNTPQHTATRSDNLNAQVLEPRTHESVAEIKIN